MKTSNSFSILFWINTSRIKNDHAQVYARVTINYKRTNISIKKSIEVTKWDANKNKAKGTDKESRIINQYIDQVRSGLFEAYKDLLYEGKLVTAKFVKARYLGTDAIHYSFKTLIEYHNLNTEKKTNF